MDFIFLPPEINSARMYTGPGSGPLLAAAGSWDSLAAELDITAQTDESVLSGLTSLHWRGPAADSMSAAAAPYMGWLHITAEQTKQTAMQARAAAAAYELAYAMTVPPLAVTANRTQLALLIATNFFGQNAAAIAATEAQYAEYWAQDAAAMSGYAANSAAAAQLTPFSSPLQTTDAAGLTAQNAAVTQANASAAATSPVSPLVSAVSQAVSAAAADPPSLTSILGDGAFSIFDVLEFFSIGGDSVLRITGTVGTSLGLEDLLGWPLPGVAPALVAAPQLSGAASSLGGGVGSSLGGGAGLGNVTAALARAGTLGSMSVPASWSAPSSSPVTALSGSGLPTLPGTGELAGSGSGMAGIPGMPGRTVSRATGVVPRYGARLTVMARPPAAG
jgi:PPE-repeat protein